MRFIIIAFCIAGFVFTTTMIAQFQIEEAKREGRLGVLLRFLTRWSLRVAVALLVTFVVMAVIV
jgi:hypothetical protein